MRPNVIRALALYSIRQDLPIARVCCPPCGTVHADSYWPPPGSMHGRAEANATERELAAKLVIAVKSGVVRRDRLEEPAGFDAWFERFAEAAP